MALREKPPSSQDRLQGVRRYIDAELLDERYNNRAVDGVGNVIRTMAEVFADHSASCIICENAERHGELIVVDFED